MGKKSPYGTIDLVLSKPYYLGGELVTGVVNLQIVAPIQANKICVKFKGVERTKIENTVVYTDAEGNMQTRQDEYKEEKEFFKNVLVLQQFNGAVIAPGAYQLPFQFQLPAQLPGVFYDERKESDGDKIKAAIMYKVKAFVDMPGKDVADKSFLIVNSLLAKSPKPVVETGSKKFMFGGSGKLYMTVELAKNVFMPGETLYCRCKIKNESKKNVKAIKIKLMREVTVKAKSKKKFKNQEMQRKVFPGCPKKSETEVMLELPLSAQMFPSTEGQLCKLKYHLDIEADVPMAPDLEVHPKIVLALLPIQGVPMFNPFACYTKGW